MERGLGRGASRARGGVRSRWDGAVETERQQGLRRWTGSGEGPKGVDGDSGGGAYGNGAGRGCGSREEPGGTAGPLRAMRTPSRNVGAGPGETLDLRDWGGSGEAAGFTHAGAHRIREPQTRSLTASGLVSRPDTRPPPYTDAESTPRRPPGCRRHLPLRPLPSAPARPSVSLLRPPTLLPPSRAPPRSLGSSSPPRASASAQPPAALPAPTLPPRLRVSRSRQSLWVSVNL